MQLLKMQWSHHSVNVKYFDIYNKLVFRNSFTFHQTNKTKNTEKFSNNCEQEKGTNVRQLI